MAEDKEYQEGEAAFNNNVDLMANRYNVAGHSVMPESGVYKRRWIDWKKGWLAAEARHRAAQAEPKPDVAPAQQPGRCWACERLPCKYKLEEVLLCGPCRANVMDAAKDEQEKPPAPSDEMPAEECWKCGFALKPGEAHGPCPRCDRVNPRTAQDRPAPPAENPTPDEMQAAMCGREVSTGQVEPPGLPRVIWIRAAGVAPLYAAPALRIVEIALGDFSMEARRDDDALGNERWEPKNIHEGCLKVLAFEYLRTLAAGGQEPPTEMVTCFRCESRRKYWGGGGPGKSYVVRCKRCGSKIGHWTKTPIGPVVEPAGPGDGSEGVDERGDG